MLFLWLLILPFCAGGLFCTKKNRISFGGQWLWGQFLLWAVFQIIAVYYILKQGSLEDVIRAHWMVTAVIALGGLATVLKLWIYGIGNAVSVRIFCICGIMADTNVGAFVFGGKRWR